MFELTIIVFIILFYFISEINYEKGDGVESRKYKKARHKFLFKKESNNE